MTQTKTSEIKKLSKKDLKDWQKWAENETLEFEKFIQIIRKELRGRRK